MKGLAAKGLGSSFTLGSSSGMFEGFGASASRAQEGADLQAQLAQLQAAKSKPSAAGPSRADQVGRSVGHVALSRPRGGDGAVRSVILMRRA